MMTMFASRGAFEDGAVHFFGGAHRNPVHAFGNFQIRGAADQNHARAAAIRRLPPARNPFCRRSDW